MHIYYVKRIDDVGDFTNVGDVPYRFVPCMVSGLAYYLAQKEKPEFVIYFVFPKYLEFELKREKEIDC